MKTYRAEYLREITRRLFERKDVPDGVSREVSRCIVDNCLYGHDSHGMALVPRFMNDLEIGKIKPEAESEIVEKAPAAAWIDGHRGFGQITMKNAVEEAMNRAEKMGIAAVTVTNSNHVGILWTSVLEAAEKGLIAMIWCSAGPQGGLVAPFGGIGKAIGTNPIACGTPAGEMPPLVFDMATSASAAGKIVLYAQQDRKIPPGWMLDEQGNPTTDPNDLLDGDDIFRIAGTLLPMAGYKGFGLGMVTEVLGGILAGYGPAYRPEYKEGNALFITAVNVKAFVPLEEFRRQVDELLRFVKSVPTDTETEEILIPGELEFRTREQREREGIPVTDPIWSRIREAADKLKVGLEED